MPAAFPTADTAVSRGVLSRRQAVFTCVTAALVLLMGAGLCAAAVLARAPTAVVPLIAVACAGMPVFAAWRLPAALAVLRHPPTGRLSLAALRRDLDRLPETEHPLGQ